jgi:hypothetical protein
MPFKLTKGPLPFLATDIGSTSFVREEGPSENNDSLPPELRKRLLEIGWADENKAVDQQVEWIQTPMSLLPLLQQDRMHGRHGGHSRHSGHDDAPLSPSSPTLGSSHSPTKLSGPRFGDGPILSRKSSFGPPSHGAKRRAVFVPALASIFPNLVCLVYHLNFKVAAAARVVLMDLMRNDPVLLSRPILDLLAGDQKDVSAAASAMRALLHVRRVLPPAMAHHVFNNLAGFLKHIARLDEASDALEDFAHVLPVMAKLAAQVGDISIRDIRRAKLEVFVIPSGSFWFTSSAPAGPMFPRKHDSFENPFGAVPARLVSMAMIRISQNMFFLAMLRRNAHDVQLVRKSMSRLVLPSWEAVAEPGPLELKDFVPHKNRINDMAPLNPGLRDLSLVLSRSYLLLVGQIFRSMSRHLNDRNELAVLIDGLNRILLAHGNDIGIVAQAMIGKSLWCFIDVR